jgi:hypothetical protein
MIKMLHNIFIIYYIYKISSFSKKIQTLQTHVILHQLQLASLK